MRPGFFGPEKQPVLPRRWAGSRSRLSCADLRLAKIEESRDRLPLVESIADRLAHGTAIRRRPLLMTNSVSSIKRDTPVENPVILLCLRRRCCGSFSLGNDMARPASLNARAISSFHVASDVVGSSGRVAASNERIIVSVTPSTVLRSRPQHETGTGMPKFVIGRRTTIGVLADFLDRAVVTKCGFAEVAWNREPTRHIGR